MKSIALVVQNVIQWYTLRPIAKKLKKEQVPFDIFVYDPEGNSDDFHAIALDTKKAITDDGYSIKKWPSKTASYQIVISPYPSMIDFKYKYLFGFRYGAASTKLSVTLKPEQKLGFHGYFMHDAYGAQLARAFTEPFLVPYIYLRQIKHQKISKKPVLLYLPTYHDISTQDVIESLAKLKDEFYIITKGHHGIDNLQEESQKKDSLAKIADEYYGSNEYICSLFDKADVVLSDNSGASMDALYAKIPIAIATKTLDPGANGIKPIQCVLIESGVIPYTGNPTPENLRKILKKAMTSKQKSIQSATSDELFPRKNGGVDAWYKIIKKYLDDEVDDYNTCLARNLISQKFDELRDECFKLANENGLLRAEQEKLRIYEASRAHRALEKILSHRHKKQKSKTQDL